MTATLWILTFFFFLHGWHICPRNHRKETRGILLGNAHVDKSHILPVKSEFHMIKTHVAHDAWSSRWCSLRSSILLSFPQAKEINTKQTSSVYLISFFAFKGAHTCVEGKSDNSWLLCWQNPKFPFLFRHIVLWMAEVKIPKFLEVCSLHRSQFSTLCSGSIYRGSQPVRLFLFIWQDTYLSNSRQMFCTTCIPFFSPPTHDSTMVALCFPEKAPAKATR